MEERNTASIDAGSLIRQAMRAREGAYAPYSGYLVGAALLCADGTIYTGCNIESASFSPTCCAERTAFFKAVSEGRRHFTAIAVVGARRGAKAEEIDFFYPCGVCRQVMMEFCDPDAFRILTARSETAYLDCTLRELLPHGFSPRDVGN